MFTYALVLSSLVTTLLIYGSYINSIAASQNPNALFESFMSRSFAVIGIGMIFVIVAIFGCLLDELSFNPQRVMLKRKKKQ